MLNEILADTMILYAMYKKHHWLVVGPTFYQLHLLFDKHAAEQNELVDLLAERVQSLGGVAVGDPRHAAELTTIDRPPNGAEEVAVMIHRLLDAHEAILEKVRNAIDKTDRSGDWGSNDLLMSDVLRRHELQVWFVASHVVEVPLTDAYRRAPLMPVAAPLGQPDRFRRGTNRALAAAPASITRFGGCDVASSRV